MRAFHRVLPAILEASLALVAALIAGGLVYLLAGHLIGGARRQSGRRQPAPSRGAVPNLRHQNVTSVSVR